MNLRKDHCRDPRRKTREPRHLTRRPRPPRPRANNPGAGRRQGTPHGAQGAAPPSAGRAPGAPHPTTVVHIPKRLSATDISALASMKNVAKCDTWCELQNPANHRVFERKLRPRPPGRGHACLGVTPRVAPRTGPARRADADNGPPGDSPPTGEERGGLKSGPPAEAGRDEWWTEARLTVHAGRRAPRPAPRGRTGTPSGRPPTPGRAALATRPQVRRGHPLSLSI